MQPPRSPHTPSNPRSHFGYAVALQPSLVERFNFGREYWHTTRYEAEVDNTVDTPGRRNECGRMESVGIACCARNVYLCRYVQLSNFSAARATSIDIIARRRDPHMPPHWAFKCPYRCMTHHAATTKALTAGHATFRTSLVKA